MPNDKKDSAPPKDARSSSGHTGKKKPVVIPVGFSHVVAPSRQSNNGQKEAPQDDLNEKGGASNNGQGPFELQG